MDPWGTALPGNTEGDFNIFPNFDPSVPSGTWYVAITTNGGFGDSLLLTSFRPSVVPLALLGTGLFGMGLARRNKKAWPKNNSQNKTPLYVEFFCG